MAASAAEPISAVISVVLAEDTVIKASSSRSRTTDAMFCRCDIALARQVDDLPLCQACRPTPARRANLLAHRQSIASAVRNRLELALMAVSSARTTLMTALIGSAGGCHRARSFNEWQRAPAEQFNPPTKRIRFSIFAARDANLHIINETPSTLIDFLFVVRNFGAR